MTAYQKLETIFTEIYSLREIVSLLHWDDAVMLPVGSLNTRATQLQSIEGIIHSILIDEMTADLLQEAKENRAKLKVAEKANFDLMEREYLHASSIPETLIRAKIKASIACEHRWRQARADNDFKSLAPLLRDVIKYTKEIAQIKSEALGLSPYDALLDQYDPGRTQSEIDPLFESLKNFLPDFIDKAIAKQQQGTKCQPLKGTFSIDAQAIFGKQLVTTLGFNNDKGRIDVSHHPFCGGNPGDVRITSRYDVNDPLSGIMAICHESGHAIYEQQLPEAKQYQPIGQSLGMSMHEGQSLLFEMQACRSKAFATFLSATMKKHFAITSTTASAGNLYRNMTQVSRSLIRVDADEVTYPLHVILRYELEQKLLSEDLLVKDLPTAWNDAMQKYLNITPKTDSDGCMQDIHWTDGSIGYFPTYTLGAMTAAQLFSASIKAEPHIITDIEKGDFTKLRKWLAKQIHQHGSRYKASDLLKKATGSPLGIEAFQSHLTTRYL